MKVIHWYLGNDFTFDKYSLKIFFFKHYNIIIRFLVIEWSRSNVGHTSLLCMYLVLNRST